MLRRAAPHELRTAHADGATGMAARDLGVYEQHGQLEGIWRDVVIVERMLVAQRPSAELSSGRE
ncbi:MAG: hypothetical protein NVS2B7_37480 [Herpetosiphon sp.]